MTQDGSDARHTPDEGEETTFSPTRLLVDTACCVRFFSRLPLPSLGKADPLDRAPDFSRMAYAVPLAGLIVTAPAALLFWSLSFSSVPALAVAALTVACLATVTGALHEDGLGDIADGFFGGATVDRRLEIMKDSRVGAFGALTLAASFLIKSALLAGLLELHGALSVLVLVAGEVFGRSLMIRQWSILPAARPGGLGHRFGTPTSRQSRLALLIGLVMILPCLSIMGGMHLAIGVLSAIFVAYGTGRLARAKIGGFTGDVLGAVQQVSAIAFLIGLQVLAP